ncbi:pilus assembly protein N-terminal domain-containing protein [Methylosinus sp. H3A]|uniref:pilus assembly protein N-terminal domain-containing protein n=1 Tax=Methylosinus sp. H3A TaxID=2785786 RepID=UPI0018C30ABB|nr:pilus assembly protein N-terminal domain-containing protein [Methylosinus sp. H3A]MBG0811412.1 pilus assembly protein N-terminal domain-containing protein [Methylosinus sp. H3A]
MRSTRFLGYLALFATVTAGVATARDSERRGVFVDVDRARVVRMPEGAQTLIVGNPLIADVTMLKTNRLIVVTGKSFGSTNLILLDPTGNQVGEEIITVTQPMDKLVVMRGARRESYACNPDCAPAVDLADDKDYTARVIEAVKQHEGSSAPTKR